MNIYCTGCERDVEARLTSGSEIYPHRTDLGNLPFWICETCRNYVGCHHKTKEPTRPLGVIATQEIMKARIKIHAVLDPLWKSGKISRGQAYSQLSKKLGYQYHTGEIRSIREARRVYSMVIELREH